jgi:hypothetical protein
MEKYMRIPALAAACISAAALVPSSAGAHETTPAQTYAEGEAAFGFVPGFMRTRPRRGIAAASAPTRDLELSTDTALSPKAKSRSTSRGGADS